MKIIALTRTNGHGVVGINLTHVISFEKLEYCSFGPGKTNADITTGTILCLSNGRLIEATEGLYEVMRLANT